MVPSRTSLKAVAMVENTYEQISDRMTTVLGFCELMLEDAYGALSPQQRRILTDVVKAARELRDLVRDEPSPLTMD